MGDSPRGRQESDTTERLSTYTRTFPNRGHPAQTASPVNSAEHLRGQLYQFATSCSRKQWRDYLVTHSVKLHRSSAKTKILITRKGNHRLVFLMNVGCKSSQQNISKLNLTVYKKNELWL